MPNYNPNLLSQYQDSLKDYRDLKDSLNTAFEEGFQDGFKGGEENKTKQIALALLSKGLDDNFVQESTGLSLAEIAQLKKEQNL